MSADLSELPASRPTQADFAALVRLANGGDEEAEKRLRELVHNWPEFWQKIGDVSKIAQTAFFKAIAGKNKMLLASIERKVEDLQGELLGPAPSALEKVLVGRIIVSLLEVEYVTAKYSADDGANIATAKLAIQLKTAAQRRFDASVKSLMLVRERLPVIERANRELKRDRRKVIRIPERVSA